MKSALGYKTKEVKVTTTIKRGEVVETIKEVTEKEQAPNVYAAQCWLYNRLPKKWKNMNSKANILDDIDEDTSLQITVTRASQNSNNKVSDKQDNNTEEKEIDENWQEEVNQSIEIRKATEEEIKEKEKQKNKKSKSKEENMKTKILLDDNDDIDYWPEDWEE